MPKIRPPFRSIATRRLFALLAAMLLLVPAGCIRSRVRINSQPEGAEVIWRGEPYGATPVTIPFIWYWHHDIALEKPGYERLEAVEHFRTPPWFLMPMDLLCEALPIPIYDTRERTYVLKPKVNPIDAPPPVREINPALPEFRSLVP
jgi:hypothetical protein